MKTYISVILFSLFSFQTYLYAQENSAAGKCYSGQSGKIYQLDVLLQGTANTSGSERVELEISGGSYQSFGQHIFLIDARGGLDVDAYQINDTFNGYSVRIYDNGNAATDNDKYIIVVDIPSGSWRSICVRARELKSRTWMDFNAISSLPSLPEVSYQTNWIFKATNNGFEVEDGIRTSEIVVEATGWPDFVFEPGYDLRSLSELEKYIKQHGHLPGIPAAEMIENEDQNLGETQKLLLQKIEELTLYVIQQQKEIERLKSQNQKEN